VCARPVFALIFLLAVAVAACGHKSVPGSATTRTTLTIYSSQPLQGLAQPQSESIVNAEKLALAEADGRIGRFTLKYVALDDGTAAAGGPDPGQTSAAARKAAQDPSTIAYLGEAAGGASTVSLPLLNEAGILQVSPTDATAGLTQREGVAKGEPDKYYPSGARTFVRVVPPDNVQAAAQVSYQREQDCTSTFVVSDGGAFGTGLAAQFALAAKAGGPAVAKTVVFPPGSKDTAALAGQIGSSHADCALLAVTSSSAPASLLTGIHHANPRVKLFGPSELAQSSIVGRLPSSVQRVTYLTSPALDPKLYPPAGQDFFSAYREQFGKDAEPVAIFGYEAMKLTLMVIQNAGDRGNDRQSVIDAAFKIKDHDSPLGRYSIDGSGDTNLSDYGAYRVERGKIVFDELIKPSQ
jgi:branched-chain amino acid transport system substrate-binding protein